MVITCTNSSPLNFGDSSQKTFKVCTFLVNVLSHMYTQWTNAGSPLPPLFNWKPENVCPVTSDFNVADYEFGELIWSTFTYKKTGVEKTVCEPFGCIVKSKLEGSIYLVFRGSKSDADFIEDLETTPVGYRAPTPNPPSDIQVEMGWYSVHSGLLTSLRTNLQKLGRRGQLLTVTGHSLGSTLATLAVPEAIASGLQANHYNSASPMVGLASFKMYYESLKVIDPRVPGWLETFRLVNLADSVPNFPFLPVGYEAVGTQVSFSAHYENKAKNHEPCCTYAYAIYNPDKPCNLAYDACEKGDK